MPKTKASAVSDMAEIMYQRVDEEIRRFALEENAVGAQARLALRLRRDKAPRDQIRAAVKPFFDAFIHIMETPNDELSRDGDGNLLAPVKLPTKPRPRRARTGRKVA